MALTLLLAKVIGLYMLIAGLAVIFRRRPVMMAVMAFVEDKSARLIVGLFSLLIGLFLVNLHNEWNTLPAAIVSLFAWVATLKGISYLILNEATIDGLVKYFYNRKWFMIDGVLAVLIGLYLAGFGYGWF